MHKILEHKITFVVAAAILAVALIAGIYSFWPSHQTLDTVAVARMDVSESVTATGQIDAARHVTLSFGRAGTVVSIPVRVGDKVAPGQLLASLDAGDLYASFRGAQADVAVQQANLSALQKGARSEQVAVNRQTVDTATLALETAVQDSYLKAADAVRNQIDQLFTNGGTANPQYNLHTESVDDKVAIQQDRIAAGEALDDLARRAEGSAYDSASLDAAFNDLRSVQSLITAVTAQVNLLNTSNSGLSQSTLDGYTAIVNAAAVELNGTIAAFNAARQGLNTANAQLALTTATGTPDAVTAQEALVAKAQANVAGIQNQIAHAVIVAPWAGVVASIAPKEGEAIAANAPAIDLISDGAYTMDIYIPESDISKVSVGAAATVSIDASDASDASGTIAAHVSSVDLAPTMRNGIGSYKATVTLDAPAATIRTGMDATATISGRTASGVLAVPSSALIQKTDGEYALVRGQNGSFAERQVVTGISGGGYTEIVSGLSEGERVATFGDGR